MKYFKCFAGLFVLCALFSGCTNTFMGTVFVLSFRDIILYVVIAFVISALIYIMSPGNRKQAFWVWFILSLLLTPLAGFIYFLILMGRKTE